MIRRPIRVATTPQLERSVREAGFDALARGLGLQISVVAEGTA